MSTERSYAWMWLQAVELVDQAERLQRRFLRYLGPGADTVTWEPPVDIHEVQEGLIVLFALPGVAPDSIEVHLDNAVLTVSATRRACHPRSDVVIRRLEIPHGRFVRQITLSGRPLKIAQSQFVNGCLEVRVVRAERDE